MEHLTSFRLVIPKEEYGQCVDFLQKGNLDVTQPESLKTPEDATLVDAKFVELVAVIAAGTIAAIALRLFDLLVQKRENGTVIDFRKDPFEVSLCANVPYGTVIVIGRRAEPQVLHIDPNGTDNLQTLITSLIESYAKGEGI